MHDFRLTTFSLPTYCEYCAGFLWGLTKQGVRCRKCHTTAHKKCAVKAATTCTGDRGLATLVRGTGSYEDITMSGSSASMSVSSQEPNSPTYARQLDSEFWQQVGEETKINNLVSAQAEQPLSLFQTLPANFMQFT
ncbi:Protein BZZ1, partial [Coemansia pectinata]